MTLSSLINKDGSLTKKKHQKQKYKQSKKKVKYIAVKNLSNNIKEWTTVIFIANKQQQQKWNKKYLFKWRKGEVEEEKRNASASASWCFCCCCCTCDLFCMKVYTFQH